tara:strand:+ start:39 stop:344 length:306 start_codon:yes stop_codon:yes gene_type:complete
MKKTYLKLDKIYSVDFDISTQLYEVVNVTHWANQPVIKTFKYQANAYKFAKTLGGSVITQNELMPYVGKIMIYKEAKNEKIAKILCRIENKLDKLFAKDAN